MNIRNINDTSFNGLWGFKTYNKQPLREGVTYAYRNPFPYGLELFQIDRFYPFADDSKEAVESAQEFIDKFDLQVEKLKKDFLNV